MLARKLPAGFIVPAQPVERDKPPAGPDWVPEIKHEGYRCWFAATVSASGFTHAGDMTGRRGFLRLRRRPRAENFPPPLSSLYQCCPHIGRIPANKLRV